MCYEMLYLISKNVYANAIRHVVELDLYFCQNRKLHSFLFRCCNEWRNSYIPHEKTVGQHM